MNDPTTDLNKLPGWIAPTGRVWATATPKGEPELVLAWRIEGPGGPAEAYLSESGAVPRAYNLADSRTDCYARMRPARSHRPGLQAA